jgi:dienelactone hydrolase
MADFGAVPAPSSAFRRPARAALAVAVALAVAACSSGDGSGGSGDAGAGAASAGRDAGADAAVDESAPEPPFATGHRALTLVDASRPTDAVPGVQPAEPDRTLEVDVVYPAEGEPSPEPDPSGEFAAPGALIDDAPPAGGTFPLVVFAHGHNGVGGLFLGLAELWAREGYVVALPTFPLSRNGVAVSDDVSNQPADVSFVIDSLADLDESDPLAGHVDAGEVVVGGHSLGGVTVLGVAYNSCCIDERVVGAIQVSGGPLPLTGGDYDDPPPTPMLLVHGVRDETVPIAIGDGMFGFGSGPIWYLRPAEATHSTVFSGEPGRLFNDAALGFLDAHLRGDDAALDAMAEEVAASGVAEWRVRE